MATLKAPVKKPAVVVSGGTANGSSLLDVFPVWTDQAGAEKETPAAGKFEDALGLALPPAAQLFCDAWKRTEELLHGAANVPLVSLKPATELDKKGKTISVVSRELDGKLYAGHETFDWLLAVIAYIMSAEKSMKKGDYLWELIQPKEKDGSPARSPSGKYRVKLFILDTWRIVTIDDRIPVDLFGRPLLVGSRPLQLWPLLLCKAILKVMAVYRNLDMMLPHQVAAFQMLTGWPQEDLLDSLGGTPVPGGALFDRLEEAVGGPMWPLQDLSAVASCCLIRRSKPQRAPPRLVVLAGPSAVGRAQLVEQLMAEYPDKFAVTVSHTTRPPREHEVEGKDYYFTDKQRLFGDIRAKRFLEAARVTVCTRPVTSSAAAAAANPKPPVSYWYGTSLATVREVAATGKVCLMSLEAQGAQALRSNKRIDGLYLYIKTSSPKVLASRQKQRLAEAPSTLAKRLAWVKQQVAKSSQPGLFDSVILNTSMDEVYDAVKEAISTLSPIIRNRLRGLPAYVLDYSDLIPPNSVEKPFLKPVILCGPNVGERRRLLEMLVDEFPDMFGFPRQHTTRPNDEYSRHMVFDGDELQLVIDKPSSTPRQIQAREVNLQLEAGKVDVNSHTDNKGTAAGRAVSNGVDEDSSWSGNHDSKLSHLLGPQPVVLSSDEFEAANAQGKFLETHADQFKHATVVCKHGHSADNVREVIKSGKLPLLELEAEGAEAIKFAKSIDCLTIFLAPPSLEEHEQRLKAAITESDDEIAERQKVAAGQLTAAESSGVFDQFVVNDSLEAGYKQLKAAISRFRPDLIPVAQDEAAALAARRAAAASKAVPLIVVGPAGGGREQLIQQLLQRYPHHFEVPKRLTNRKPAKGEKDLTQEECVKPEQFVKLAAQGQVAWSQQDQATGVTVGITVDALHSVLAAGKMAIVDIGQSTSEQLQTLKQHAAFKDAFAVYVLRNKALAASLTAAGLAGDAARGQLERAAAQLQEATAVDSLVQALVIEDDPEQAFAQLQEPLSTACPKAMPSLLLPLVVAAPFGSGKRAVLQQLVKALPEVLSVPRVVTTKPRPLGSSVPEDMEVISSELAQQLQHGGSFLVQHEVLGHTYGITTAAVRKLQASGKLPLLDLDRVADVQKLKAAGFKATYVYLQPPSLQQLRERVKCNLLANAPPQHDPAHAADAAAAEAVKEAAAAAEQAQLFDAVITHDPQELLSTAGRLSELLHECYPLAVPPSAVWGYGRPLWDPSCRVYGRKPLRILLLGPAASGKSTASAILASRFGIPHINAGDLLYAEVAAKTPLGLEAKQYMHSSRTVPDRMLLSLLLRRLDASDCQAQGWALDGFPHTRKQAEVLADAGHVPDKVILLEGPHALLLDRVKHRRIDYKTGKVYHLAEPGALSEAVRPVKADGSPDQEVLQRLAVRHDDSLENVANRLALWDRQVQGLRAVYEDVILRLPAAGSLQDIAKRAEAFIRLEADIMPSKLAAVRASGSTGTSIELTTTSWKLEELTYRVVTTLRYKRQQLVQLQQLDGKLAWCDLKELASNSSCMLLAHNPTGLPIVKSSKCLDNNSIPKQQLVAVDSPEPFRLLVCLAMGPQHPATPPAPFQKKVFVLAGPAGAGRTTLAQQLLHDFPDKLQPAPVLTDRPPRSSELPQKPSISTQLLLQAAARPGDSGQPPRRITADSQQASSGCGATGPVSAATPASYTGGLQQPVRYSGPDLLQFVPEQQFKELQCTNQLLGLHEHLGSSYAVAGGSLEEAAAAGKTALVVGSLQLAEHLRKEQLETQVVCIYIDADMACIDCRLRESKQLEEQELQQTLKDAQQQKELLQWLLHQQTADVKAAEQQAAIVAAAAAAPSVPATPKPGAGRATVGIAGPAAGSAMKSTYLSQVPAAASLPQQQPADSTLEAAAVWLESISNHAGRLQLCYSQLKAVLAKHWPSNQQFMPGLLLLQRCIVSTSGGSSSSSTAVTSNNGTGPVDIESGAAASGAGDVYSQSRTVLRLKAATAAGSLLRLPRGKHLLQLQCSSMLLHCAAFYAAGDFTLDDASKLLPAVLGMHVMMQEGQVDSLQPGSRQLLFRYLLKPAEACSAFVGLHTSNSALLACSQLLLVDVASKEVVKQIVNQASEVQLAASDKGYMLLALLEPHCEVPAGSWRLSIDSNKALPPLQEVPCVRQVLFDGIYTANAKAFLARFVISPSAAVHLALVSEVKVPNSSSKQPGPPNAANTTVSPKSYMVRAAAPMPLRYSLQILDTAGAKDISWTGSYKLLAEAIAGPDGRAMLPSVQLQPGKYLVVMQLQFEASLQWVDPSTGSADLAPSWQLLMMPNADEKACPIARDDAWDRHFRATIEGWQQQAMQKVASTGPTTTGRPGSSGASSAARGGAAAAVKDRPKHAQAALDKYTVEQGADLGGSTADAASGGSSGQGPAGKPAAAGSRAKTPPAIAAGSTGAARPVPATAAEALTPPQPPAVVARQLKSAEVLQFSPAAQVRHVLASSTGGTAWYDSGSATGVANGSLGHRAESAGRTRPAALQQPVQQQGFQQGVPNIAAAATRGAHQPTGALQAQEAARFADWRNGQMQEHQAIVNKKQELLKVLAPPPVQTAAAFFPVVNGKEGLTHKEKERGGSKGHR